MARMLVELEVLRKEKTFFKEEIDGLLAKVKVHYQTTNHNIYKYITPVI